MAQVRVAQVPIQGIQIGTVGALLNAQITQPLQVVSPGAAIQLGKFNNTTGTFYRDPTNPSAGGAGQQIQVGTHLANKTLGYIVGTGTTAVTTIATQILAGAGYFSIWNNGNVQQSGITIQIPNSTGQQAKAAGSIQPLNQQAANYYPGFSQPLVQQAAVTYPGFSQPLQQQAANYYAGFSQPLNQQAENYYAGFSQPLNQQGANQYAGVYQAPNYYAGGYQAGFYLPAQYRPAGVDFFGYHPAQYTPAYYLPPQQQAPNYYAGNYQAPVNQPGYSQPLVQQANNYYGGFSQPLVQQAAVTYPGVSQPLNQQAANYYAGFSQPLVQQAAFNYFGFSQPELPTTNQPLTGTVYNGSLVNPGQIASQGFAITIPNIGTLTTQGGVLQGTGVGGFFQGVAPTYTRTSSAAVSTQQGIVNFQQTTRN